MTMQVGIVWATNVGKSTLFNRLISQFRAIVTDIPGTTTDILYHETILDELWKVIFADSPWLIEFYEERPFIQKIIDESDLILFVVDDIVGITAKEQYIAEYIRNQPDKANQTILIVNKLDKKRKESETDLALSDYYSLGFDDLVGISAKTKRNLPKLQYLITEKWVSYLQNAKPKSTETHFSTQKGIPIAILGKPNAGKSTLLNTLVGTDLAKVENVPGTTRDYVVWSFEINKKTYTIYDTAGIKKQGSMRGIERIAYKKTMDMLEFIRPVVIFVIDATQWVTHRDMSILWEINRLSLPIIFALNKSDLLSKKEMSNIVKTTQAIMDFAKYIPILPISAQTGAGTQDFFQFVHALRKETEKRVPTTDLNRIIASEYFQRPPRFPKNKICKIMYITQIDVNAPTFMVFVNHKNRVNSAFKKRVENSIRKHYGFVGVPIVIRFRDRKEWNEDRSAPWLSIETIQKAKEKRQEEISKNAKKILEKRRKKKNQ